MNILYICDGCVEKCKDSINCYRNGGDCNFTNDVEHAKNFTKVFRDSETTYIESLEEKINSLQERNLRYEMDDRIAELAKQSISYLRNDKILMELKQQVSCPPPSYWNCQFPQNTI